LAVGISLFLLSFFGAVAFLAAGRGVLSAELIRTGGETGVDAGGGASGAGAEFSVGTGPLTMVVFTGGSGMVFTISEPAPVSSFTVGDSAADDGVAGAEVDAALSDRMTRSSVPSSFVGAEEDGKDKGLVCGGSEVGTVEPLNSIERKGPATNKTTTITPATSVIRRPQCEPVVMPWLSLP